MTTHKTEWQLSADNTIRTGSHDDPQNRMAIISWGVPAEIALRTDMLVTVGCYFSIVLFTTNSAILVKLNGVKLHLLVLYQHINIRKHWMHVGKIRNVQTYKSHLGHKGVWL